MKFIDILVKELPDLDKSFFSGGRLFQDWDKEVRRDSGYAPTCTGTHLSIAAEDCRQRCQQAYSFVTFEEYRAALIKSKAAMVLPPVGTIARLNQWGVWKDVKIIAHYFDLDTPVAIYMPLTGDTITVGQASAAHFRSKEEHDVISAMIATCGAQEVELEVLLKAIIAGDIPNISYNTEGDL